MMLRPLHMHQYHTNLLSDILSCECFWLVQKAAATILQYNIRWATVVALWNGLGICLIEVSLLALVSLNAYLHLSCMGYT